MSLTPTFSVTPLNPRSAEWNHYAILRCFGNHLADYSPRRLADQHWEDKAVLRFSPLAAPAPATIPDVWSRYSLAYLAFQTNATPENQYLLIYHVFGFYGAKAAFYLNGNLLRSEDVGPGREYIAILVDCPPPQTRWYAYMFLVGEPVAVLELRGIECYIL